MSSSNLDLIVLTYNEELNLEYCLQSVQGLVQNIFVVDSGSTDQTVNIARQFKAHVVYHPFTTQTEQLNWALDNLPIQSEWVLRLDGDEHLLPELRDEIAGTLHTVPPEISGFYIKRRMIFLGRWIRHGGYYPTWILRLFRHKKARSEVIAMNEHVALSEGRSARLANDFVDEEHEGLGAWILKHEGFASRQARVLSQMDKGYDSGWIRPDLLGEQPQRKRWLLHHFYRRLPLFLRSFFYFFYRYFFRFGFLDGPQGLIFHFLQGCWYPFYTDAKLYEGRPRR